MNEPKIYFQLTKAELASFSEEHKNKILECYADNFEFIYIKGMQNENHPELTDCFAVTHSSFTGPGSRYLTDFIGYDRESDSIVAGFDIDNQIIGFIDSETTTTTESPDKMFSAMDSLINAYNNTPSE